MVLLKYGNSKLKYSFEGHTSHTAEISSFTSLENGFIASSSYEPRYNIKIWDLNIGELVHTFDSYNDGHYDEVLQLATLQNGYLVSLSKKDIKIWDVVRLK